MILYIQGHEFHIRSLQVMPNYQVALGFPAAYVAMSKKQRQRLQRLTGRSTGNFPSNIGQGILAKSPSWRWIGNVNYLLNMEKRLDGAG